MGQKYQLILNSIIKFAEAEPYIAGVVALFVIYFLIKKAKQLILFGMIGGLGLLVWVWYSSSAENKNKNKKFQRYQVEKLNKSINVD